MCVVFACELQSACVPPFQFMGIEVNPKYGGTGASFISAILAIEELAKVDPSVSVLCDVQNTLVNEYFKRYASAALQDKYLPQLVKKAVSFLCSSIQCI